MALGYSPRRESVDEENMPATPHRLKTPSAVALTRATDRLSFLYLDRCHIRQDNNNTIAEVTNRNGHTRTTRIPTTILAALLLGPGTSITQQAVAQCSRSGCSITFIGSGGTRHYGTFLCPNTSTALLSKQAQICSNTDLRISAAITLYNKRFPNTLNKLLGNQPTLEQLRGLEGARVKALYSNEARKAKLKNWRRKHSHNNHNAPLDPVNEALNYANTALYGITHAIIQILGLSPGLGIIHEGNRQAFTLDIADIYKPTTSIPLAFAVRNETNPGDAALTRLRETMTLIKLIPHIVQDIHDVLNEQQPADSDDWDIDSLNLWAGQDRHVPAGYNYSPHWLDEAIQERNDKP